MDSIKSNITIAGNKIVIGRIVRNTVIILHLIVTYYNINVLLRNPLY